MKKFNAWTAIAILLTSVLYAALAFGQEDKEMKYLFSGSDISISGFGGPAMSLSQIQGDFAVFTGGGGAVLLNHAFFIGGYGEGLSTNHEVDELHMKNDLGNITSFPSLKTNFGYGGFWLGYIHHHKKAVHFGISTKAGMGMISLAEDEFHVDRFDNIMNDQVFVVSPQVEVELNLYRWFKVNAGIGYRFVGGIDKTYLNPDGESVKYFKTEDFSQPQLTLGLLFGGFDN